MRDKTWYTKTGELKKEICYLQNKTSFEQDQRYYAQAQTQSYGYFPNFKFPGSFGGLGQFSQFGLNSQPVYLPRKEVPCPINNTLDEITEAAKSVKIHDTTRDGDESPNHSDDNGGGGDGGGTAAKPE